MLGGLSPLPDSPPNFKVMHDALFKIRLYWFLWWLQGVPWTYHFLVHFPCQKGKKKKGMENLHYCERVTRQGQCGSWFIPAPCPVGGQSQFIQPMLLGKESPVQTGYEFVPPYNTENRVCDHCFMCFWNQCTGKGNSFLIIPMSGMVKYCHAMQMTDLVPTDR